MKDHVFRMDMFYPSKADVPGRKDKFYDFLQAFAPGAHAEYHNDNGLTISVVGSGQRDMRSGILAAAREIFG
jgi:hypothetical protein